MSSMNINSLLARVAPQWPVQNQRANGQPELQKAKIIQPPADKFTQGEWWKNYAGRSMSSEGEPPVYSRPLVRSIPGSAVGSSEEAADSEIKETSSGRTEAQEPVVPNEPAKPDGAPLSQSEKLAVAALKEADMKVRAHEQAHLAAAGGIAKGGATYKYQRGPDGKNYAVGGEVQIDMGKESTPEATIEKMRLVRRAALAPADPSPQDQKVAAQATIRLAESMQELNLGRNAENTMPEKPFAEEETAADSNLNSGGVSGENDQFISQEISNSAPKRFLQNYQYNSQKPGSGQNNLILKA